MTLEPKLQIFIDGIIHYFEQTNEKFVKVHSPYLIEEGEEIATDYTGIIDISGAYKGSCYFTATRELLQYLIKQLGETDTSEDMMVDAIGEIANILSGNVRKQLGEEFIISTPRVFIGKNSTMAMENNNRIYGIPLQWKTHSALIGIHLS
ncbi:MAG: chemotaxis protein CheX [Arenicella sp.]